MTARFVLARPRLVSYRPLAFVFRMVAGLLAVSVPVSVSIVCVSVSVSASATCASYPAKDNVIKQQKITFEPGSNFL